MRSGVMMGSGSGGMPPGMHMGPQTIDAHSLLTSWATGQFPLAALVVLAALAVWYVRAVHLRDARVHADAIANRGRTTQRWARRRVTFFILGLAAIELALGSPVPTLSDSHFPAHICQHLLLMMVAPPLLALAAPMTLLLQTSSRPTKRRLLSALHSRPFAVLTHPVPVFFLYYGSMFAFFLSPALGYAMDNMWLMDVINLGFLGGATLFWWPMIGSDPIPRWSLSPGLKILNLLIGVPFESFLSIALLMEASPVAPMYTLGSTHTGGGLLWALSELFTAISVLPLFVQWTRADARLAQRIDARIDAGENVMAPPLVGHGLAATMRTLRRG